LRGSFERTVVSSVAGAAASALKETLGGGSHEIVTGISPPGQFAVKNPGLRGATCAPRATA